MEIDPDEILIDSSNIPNFDKDQFEGRLERPISRTTLYTVAGIFVVLLVVFIGQAVNMQIVHGQAYRTKSENNLLRPVPIFAGRGVIYDRNGVPLAWNAPMGPDPTADSVTTDTTEAVGTTRNDLINFAVSSTSSSTSTNPTISLSEDTVARRMYATSTGLAHILGYVQYPSKDSNGFYYQNDFEGIGGAEQYYNSELQGTNGSRLVEVDAHGNVLSQNVIQPPVQGQNVTLSIDSRVQSALYDNIETIATKVGYTGGAGVIMNVKTGEILAMTSYPEFDPQVMSDKTDPAAVQAELNDPGLPFLNRAVDGLFTPGSIVKPYEAMGALNEHTIDPSTVIDTTGSISIPDPYDPTKVSLFKDWKDLGPLDMRHAIAMSSDAYFYIVGGGYQGQKGLGIANIDKYFGMFGFGEAVPSSFTSGPAGVVSSPAWKEATFGEPWYLGDTYHTAIGQYGTQVTPVQVVRAVAAMANEGTLLIPTVVEGDGPHVERTIDLPKSDFDIVHQGMRLGVLQGVAVALNVPYVQVAGKSGTAELGVAKTDVNSWITGFWPYDDPQYAFAVTLEKGSVHETSGAAAAMRLQLDWMEANTPQYFNDPGTTTNS